MKHRSEVIVSGFAALCLAAILFHAYGRTVQPSSPQGTALTVMTYNIHQGFDNSGKVDPRVFLKSIRAVDPDLVGLQESETNRPAVASYDLVRWLATNLSMASYYGPPTKQQIYGVSLLSKYPLRDSVTIPLPSTRDPRVLIESTITYRGRDVRVMVAHLGLSAEDRFHQLRYILEERVKKSALPVILMGDFNTTADEDFTLRTQPTPLRDGWYPNRLALEERRAEENRTAGVFERARAANFRGLADYREELTDAWRLLHPTDDDAYTWFDTNEALGRPYEKLDPPERIDYLFVSSAFQPLSAQIIRDRNTIVASDHLPVIATLRFKAGK